jgi:hypothetical protein
MLIICLETCWINGLRLRKGKFKSSHTQIKTRYANIYLSRTGSRHFSEYRQITTTTEHVNPDTATADLAIVAQMAKIQSALSQAFSSAWFSRTSALQWDKSTVPGTSAVIVVDPTGMHFLYFSDVCSQPLQ